LKVVGWEFLEIATLFRVGQMQLMKLYARWSITWDEYKLGCYETSEEIRRRADNKKDGKMQIRALATALAPQSDSSEIHSHSQLAEGGDTAQDCHTSDM
jgi:hypothetical protein